MFKPHVERKSSFMVDNTCVIGMIQTDDLHGFKIRGNIIASGDHCYYVEWPFWPRLKWNLLELVRCIF